MSLDSEIISPQQYSKEITMLKSCFNYIHFNPVKGRLVLSPEQYPYSSFCDYALLRNGTICNKKLAEDLLNFQCGRDFISFSNEIVDPALVRRLF